MRRRSLPAGSLVNLSLCAKVRAICRAAISSMGAVLRRTENALVALRDLSDNLLPLREARCEKLGVSIMARNLNLPMLQWAVSHSKCGCASLVIDLADGMPIGGMEASGSPVMRQRDAKLGFTEWANPIPSRNRGDIERVGHFRTTEMAVACWVKSLTKIAAGGYRRRAH